MIKHLERVIAVLEKSEGTFMQFFAGMLAVMMIRTMMEVLLDYKWSLLPTYPVLTLLHYTSSYFAMLMTIVIIIALLAKTDIVKTFRVSAIFLMAIFLAPLLDTLLQWGFDVRITYIKSFDNIIFNYLTFFGNSITSGLRIEIFLICLFSAAYIYLKTRKVLASALGFVTVYTSLFCYFVMPLMLFRFDLMTGFSQRSVSAVYLYALTALLIIFLWKYSHEKFIAVIKNLRLLRITHYLIMLLLGAWLASPENPLIWPVIHSAFALFFAWQFAVATNDLEDVNIDRLSNKKRPLSAGELSAEEMKVLAHVFLIFSLCFAYLAGVGPLVLVLTYHSLYFIYSVKPFRIKKYTFLTNAVIGAESLVAALIGYAAATGGTIENFPKNIAAIVFFSFWLGAYMKDLKDYEGDKKEKIYTLPVLLGLRNGKLLTSILLGASYLLPIFLLNLKTALFVAIAIILLLVNVWAINRKNFREKYIFINYYVYAFVIMLHLA